MQGVPAVYNPKWRYFQGNTVTMELNMIQKRLKYLINGQDIDCNFDNIRFESHTTYNIAISAGNPGTFIKLEKYEKRYRFN